jgi:hypothetical protein
LLVEVRNNAQPKTFLSKYRSSSEAARVNGTIDPTKSLQQFDREVPK